VGDRNTICLKTRGRFGGDQSELASPETAIDLDRLTCGVQAVECARDPIVSPVAHRPSLQRMGVETKRTVNVGGFTEGQRKFLDFYRNATKVSRTVLSESSELSL